jgi:cytochrome c5
MKAFKASVAFLVALGFLGISLVQFSYSQDKTGKTIFEESKCTACHSITSQGIEAKKKSDKTPDLSKLTEGHDADFFMKFLKKEETMNNKKHAIAFKGSDEDLKMMIDWLVSINGK